MLSAAMVVAALVLASVVTGAAASSGYSIHVKISPKTVTAGQSAKIKVSGYAKKRAVIRVKLAAGPCASTPQGEISPVVIIGGTVSHHFVKRTTVTHKTPQTLYVCAYLLNITGSFSKPQKTIARGSASYTVV